MPRSKAFIPLGLFLLLTAAQGVYAEASSGGRALLLFLLAGAGAAGAVATARDAGLLAATVFHTAALFAALFAALYQALLARVAGILGGPAAPLAGALLAVAALERHRPSPILRAAAGILAALATLACLDHAPALLPALLALPIPLLAFGRIGEPRRRAAAIAAWSLPLLLFGLPIAERVNRASSAPAGELSASGFRVLWEPLAGPAAVPLVPGLADRRLGTLEVGAERTWPYAAERPGDPAPLLAGRRPFLAGALPGLVEEAEGIDGAVRATFVPDALRLLPSAAGFPFSRRALLRLPLRRGGLGFTYLERAEETGEIFSFPPRLLAAAPARAFLCAGGGALHYLDEEAPAAGEPPVRSLRALDAAGRLRYARPLPFEPLDLVWAGGPVVAGVMVDPVTLAETHLVEFRDGSGEVERGYTFPDRILRLVAPAGSAGALVFHGDRATLVRRDGAPVASAARGAAGPPAAAAGGTAEVLFLDYLDGALRAVSVGEAGTLAVTLLSAPRADFLAVSAGRVLLGDFAAGALYLAENARGPFLRLEPSRRGIRFLAAAPAGGFLVADESGLLLLAPDGSEVARGPAGRRTIAPPEPFAGGFAACDGERLLLLAPDLTLRGVFSGALRPAP